MVDASLDETEVGRPGRSARVGLVAGPLLFLLLLWVPEPAGMSPEAWRTAAITVWVATWWVTEAVPIYATALLPLVLFPAARVTDAAVTASAYAEPTVFLFLGGFMLAAAMQRWGLHRRIAVYTLIIVGASPRQLLLGVMVATAVMSMWVSNTATALMVYPIALAVADRFAAGGARSGMATALMLGTAYAASIGGVGTLIGTPPNAILAGQAGILYPELAPITFARWMFVGVAFVALALPLAWLVLSWIHLRGTMAPEGAEEPVRQERDALGRPSRAEWSVFVVFMLAVAGWVFRSDLVLGPLTVPGWADALGLGPWVHDATVAVAAAALLFVIPVDWGRRTFVLDWETAVKIPWGVLILFGGGFALAAAFEATGLTMWVGQRLTVLEGVPLPLLVLIAALGATFLSEIVSNTALAAIFVPIAGAVAEAIGVHPYLLMMPVAIAASAAFMMPVGTPPNAIVFGSGHLRVADMVRAGLLLNLLGSLVVVAVVFLVAAPLFGLL
jgi:sodium-dependent dicarboxylate transporter 2/3/5